MRDPKEPLGKETVKGPAQTGVKAGSSAAQATNAAAGMKFCHGSVCLGNQKPTSCICPTDKK